MNYNMTLNDNNNYLLKPPLMYRHRNKQKYFTQHYCGKVKAEAASPGHKKSPTDSLSLTQVLHKRKFFLSYLVAKKMQTSAKNWNSRKKTKIGSSATATSAR